MEFYLLVALAFYVLGYWQGYLAGRKIGKLDAMIEANELRIAQLEIERQDLMAQVRAS